MLGWYGDDGLVGVTWVRGKYCVWVAVSWGDDVTEDDVMMTSAVVRDSPAIYLLRKVDCVVAVLVAMDGC